MKWTPKNLAIAAAAVVVTSWYLKKKAGEAVADVGQAVNPVNPENVFNRGFNALYSAVTDGKGTAGTDLADWNAELNEKYYKYTPFGWFGDE